MASTEAPVPRLVKPQGRNGVGVPVNLVYNSQNWRQDSGVNWQLGSDVGYGFGWQMLVGSVVPYYAAYPNGVDHYVYTDSTEAQYRLDQNSGTNVWGSTQGIYVWFDATSNILHFRDGWFWVMGCTSGGEEADAGTMYPTVIEDVSGNQVLVTYDTALGLPYSAAGQIFFHLPEGRSNHSAACGRGGASATEGKDAFLGFRFGRSDQLAFLSPVSIMSILFRTVCR